MPISQPPTLSRAWHFYSFLANLGRRRLILQSWPMMVPAYLPGACTEEFLQLPLLQSACRRYWFGLIGKMLASRVCFSNAWASSI